MTNTLPAFVLGYHGCDRKVADKVISGQEPHLVVSENSHDWLGHGIYFWENDPLRALEWAQNRAAKKVAGSTLIEEPAVIGAVIDLGNCLNMMERTSIKLLESAHRLIDERAKKQNLKLPENQGGSEKLRRNLDCFIINALHRIRATTGDAPFDSVRSLFTEGSPIYPSSGFKQRSHIQVCVRNLNGIKGYFHPKEFGITS